MVLALDLAPSSLVTISAASGLASHWLYFIRGEHHTEGLRILASIFAGFCVLFYFLQQGNSLLYAFALSCAVSSTYIVSLWTSMFIYRGFFHRLRGFKGPPLAKFTQLYHTYIDRRLNNHLVLDGLHKQYGDFIRMGPSELSIVSPSAMHEIYGPQSKCAKGPWYDMSLPLMSLQTARDRDVHNSRRRVWDKGFSTKALNDYEVRVAYHTGLLMDRLAERSGQTLDASLWFNFYSYDVMGDMAFGKSFKMLESGEEHFAVKLLHEGMIPIGILGTIPWSLKIISSIPGATAGYNRFLKYCEDNVNERKAMKGEKPDVFSWLLKAPGCDGSQEAQMWLNGDARLIIVAGSDTTATTLTFLFYEVAKNPEILQKIREEVSKLDNFSNKELTNCDYLNGAINETLRLHPPVPSGLLRLTPPEGITVDGTYIPGGITVCVPHRQTSRDPRNYYEPLKFMPERWYSQPEAIINKTAYAPFGGGVYSCVGKQLALMEIRLVAARIAMDFVVGFGDGEDGHRLLNDTMDTFTVAMAPFDVRFTKRT